MKGLIGGKEGQIIEMSFQSNDIKAVYVGEDTDNVMVKYPVKVLPVPIPNKAGQIGYIELIYFSSIPQFGEENTPHDEYKFDKNLMESFVLFHNDEISGHLMNAYMQNFPGYQNIVVPPEKKIITLDN